MDLRQRQGALDGGAIDGNRTERGGEDIRAGRRQPHEGQPMRRTQQHDPPDPVAHRRQSGIGGRGDGA
jgi:hypothetical protein